ncbi:SRPBCC family protein [Streptomyces sp. NPDC052101]|uniref:SRPBCC family protein n=1 Tax=Streptomyces sp. NPDC052101 TaxID=3155763 RepID=UPI003419DD6B
MIHGLRPEDLGFLDSAPFRQTCTRRLHVPVGPLFDQLAGHPENWPRWFAPADDVHYEGAAPYGVGTMRFFRLYRLVRARERIIAWDPGERFSYRVQEVNVPGVSALMEQWTLAPLTDTTTSVRWTLAVDGRPPVRLLLRASRHHIDKLFHDAAQRLENLCLSADGPPYDQ